MGFDALLPRTGITARNGDQNVRKTLVHSQPQQASLPHSPDTASGEKIDEIYGLVRELKVAVEDIRDQLTGQRKEFYSVEEVAELTARSGYTIRRWISEGRIKATRVDGTRPRGRLLIPHAELGTLVAQGLGTAIPVAGVV